ncbi:MAG TPA: LamG-like jellyroll fold domain-containing protein [Anaerolineae bacterium]|nr:LamG-like jellyroll fold domain-containing protein [Anaerolineae bacterium]
MKYNRFSAFLSISTITLLLVALAIYALPTIAQTNLDMTPLANQHPLTLPDVYTTSINYPLNLTAPGILANDTDSEGDPFTINNTINFVNGSLDLNPDGSLIYTPSLNFEGSSHFFYYVNHDNSLLAHWTFENDDIFTVYDISGNNRHQSYINGFLRATNDVPSALNGRSITSNEYLNDTSNTYTSAANGTPIANQSFTVASWVRRNYINTTETVISQGSITTIDTLIFGFLADNQFVCSFNSSNRLTSGTTYTDTDWHHWACTYDVNTGTRTIYRDGVPIASDTSVAYTGTGSVLIGRGFNASDYFGGFVDDVRIYNTAITPDNMDAIMGGHNMSIVTLNVINNPPIAIPDTYTLTRNTPFTITNPSLGLLANDTTPYISTLTTTAILHANPQGNLTVNPDGTFAYHPNHTFCGTDRFSYRVDNGYEISDYAFVTLNIICDPLTIDDYYNGTEDTTLYATTPISSVITNDNYIGSNPLNAQVLSPPTTGNLNFMPAGTFVYTPALNANGAITFTYALTDGTNIGTGTFSSGPSLDNIRAYDVATADFNGDGFDDLLFANWSSQPSKIWFSNGDGTFTLGTQNLGTYNSEAVDAADLDNDGDIDAVIAGSEQYARVYINDGTGTFTITNFAYYPYASDVDLVDLNGDGYTDAFLTSSSENRNRVWINDGTGNFTDINSDYNMFSTEHSSFGDVDADGDLDMVTSSGVSGITLWLNDGNGNFTAVSTFGIQAYDADLADFDNDGDLDALVSTQTSNTSRNEVWLNDGFGNFTTNSNYWVTSYNTTPNSEFADIDNDGDVDIITANGDHNTRIWENNGLAMFTLKQTISTNYVRDVKFGDFDGDGDLDFAAARDFTGSATFFNQNSWWQSNPALVTINLANTYDPPSLQDDVYTSNEDETFSLSAPGIISNDTYENTPITAILQTGPVSGDLQFNSDGSFTYTPLPNAFGTITFTYNVTDGISFGSPATVVLAINPINDFPIAVNNQYTFTNQTPFVANVILDDTGEGADIELDGDAIRAVLATSTTTGTLQLSDDGTFTYSPDVTYTGIQTFSYYLNDIPSATAHWPFEDGISPTADISGNNHNATLSGGPTFSSAVPTTIMTTSLQSLAFDNSNDTASATGISLNNQSFTVAFWAKRDSLNTDDFIISQGTATTNQGLHIGFRGNNAFTCAFWGNDLDTTTVYTDTDWHHWACVYDSNNAVRTVYRDGVAVGQQSGIVNYTGTGSLYIGSRFGSSGWYHGLVDDVRIYQQPLPTSAIQTLANNLPTLSNTAIVTLTITENRPPLATNNQYTITTNTILTGNVILDDTGQGIDNDAENDPFKPIINTMPITGTLNLYADGTFNYNPATFTGVTTFTYNLIELPNLLSYWPIEDISQPIHDIINNYDGVFLNSVSLTTATPPALPRSTQSLAFNGIDGTVNAPGPALSNRSFTIAAWAKRNQINSEQFILSQGIPVSNNGLHIGFRGSNTFTCAFWGNDIDTIAYTDTDWHHWACTYNIDTGERVIYRDGVAVANDIATTPFQGSGDIYIGSTFNSGRFFNGYIDDLRIYSQALTSGEINDLANDIKKLSNTATVTITVESAALPTPPDPTISLSGNDISLSWDTIPNATTYQIWHSLNTPYFTPTTCASPAPYTCTTQTNTTYTHPNAAGDPSQNYFYYVLALNNNGASDPVEHRGIFTFALTAGN